MENDLLYETLVVEVASGRDALLDDIGRLVCAEICADVDPLAEAQAKTHHQVAEPFAQQGELRVRMQEMQNELETQRNTDLKARSEALETRASSSQAERLVEKLRQEAARTAASVPPPQPAPISALADWSRRPHPAKVQVVVAQVVSRDAPKELLA